MSNLNKSSIGDHRYWTHPDYDWGPSVLDLVISGDVTHEEKEDNMNKYWIIDGRTSPFNTYDEAETAAKRKLAANPGQENWKIYEFVAAVVTPTPTYEVVKPTA